jgi:hypothetical protein
MKLKLFSLALLSVFLALPAFAAAQNSTSGSGTGQYALTVWGFAPVAEGSTTCQPGGGTTFPACALPPLSLGTAYSATLKTIGPVTSVTCTVATGTLPAGLTLTSSGTSCVLAGTPTSTGSSDVTLTFTGS